MKNEDLRKHIKEYAKNVRAMQRLTKYKELEARNKELKELITNEMKEANIIDYQYAGLFIKYIAEHMQKGYTVPDKLIKSSVRIQGGAR